MKMKFDIIKQYPLKDYFVILDSRDDFISKILNFFKVKK